jgi:hypothetical protein
MLEARKFTCLLFELVLRKRFAHETSSQNLNQTDDFTKTRPEEKDEQENCIPSWAVVLSEGIERDRVFGLHDGSALKVPGDHFVRNIYL